MSNSKLINNMKKNLKSDYITYAFLSIYLIIGLSIYKDFGIGIEEHFQRKSGFYWLNYFLEFTNFDLLKNSAQEKYNQIKTIANLVDIETHLNYGILFDFPMALFETIFNFEGKSVFESRHLVNFLIFFISGIYFFKIIKIRFNNSLISLVGVSIYLLLPKSFGSSFFDSKDLFFLSILTINYYFYVKFEINRNKLNLFYFALFSAFSTSSRIFGLIVPISFIIIEFFYLINAKSLKRVKFTIIYLLFFIFSLFIHWPYLWMLVADFNYYLEPFSVRSDLKVLFDGFYYNSQNLPIIYIPKLIFFSTPILIVILFSLGFLYILKRIYIRIINIKSDDFKQDLWRGLKEKIDLFFLLNISIILFHYFSFYPNLYGGWRHYIFINFFISFFSVYGFYTSLNYLNINTKKIIYTIMLFFLSNLIYNLYKYHPYQSYYFNNLVDENSKINFQIDTQSLSRVDALEFILKNSQNKNKIFISTASWTPLEDAKYFIDKNNWNKLVFLGTSNTNNADYIYSNHFYEVDININNKYKIPSNFSILKELNIDGSRIYTIYKRTN